MRDFLMFLADTFLTLKVFLFLLLTAAVVILVILPSIFFYLRWKYSRKSTKSGGATKVAFFHPYCNAGGGGEKVLWTAVQMLQKRYPSAEFYIYTGDIEATPVEIIDRVNRNLNVQVNKRTVHFVYLHKRRWIEAYMYPYFTLLGQSLGSVLLALEALKQLTPDIYIDTTGCAFTLPLFKYVACCKTACYVHFPTITTDMLRRVANRQSMYNNRNVIARSPFLTSGKLLYYRFFAWLYALAGQCSDITLVNSTFTLDHLNSLWNCTLHLVYPPCDVQHLMHLERTAKSEWRILSLSQFRPEKDHPLQLQAMYELRELLPEKLFSNVKLVMVGGCRNASDAERVQDLKDLAKHLSLEEHVEFRVNISYEELKEELQRSRIGIHTMCDEHFGIGVVELMAAGLVVVAHRSGGPLLDIVETAEASRLGFLACSAMEYAHTLRQVIYMDAEELKEIKERARASVERFSTLKFQEDFLRAVEPLFKK